jgi:nitrate/nitrite transporter NarK
LSCVAAGVGLVSIGAFAQTPPLAFGALVLGVTGVLSAFAPFWPMPAMMLAGTGAAAGIALINSIGNLSGWIAPFIVGWLLDVTGSASAGLYIVAGLEVLAAILILAFIPRRVSD